MPYTTDRAEPMLTLVIIHGKGEVSEDPIYEPSPVAVSHASSPIKIWGDWNYSQDWGEQDLALCNSITGDHVLSVSQGLLLPLREGSVHSGI